MRLYGKNPILERLKANPKSLKKIYVQQGHPEASYIQKKAKKWGIALHVVAREQIAKMTRNLNSQGLLADVDDFAYQPYADLIEAALAKKWSLLFLDNLNDPQNLGVIIRSVACLGDFAIVLPQKESVEVTEAVLRIASGGENFVPIAKVPNLNHAISVAKEKGYWIAGAFVEEGEDLARVQLPFPLGLVVGSEHKGIREGIRKNVDVHLTIPMAQPRLSLNAAQAATILCYEITKQKKNNGS